MPSVCFYFQVHQPYRLRNVAPFSEAEGSDLFCDTANSGILWKVARKCYLPTNNKILELIKRFDGRFKVSYSLSGVAIEQMKQFAPDVLDSFVKLADTGCVEFLAETYMIYASCGRALRESIREFAAPAREAWDEVYRIFCESFDGIEYE